MVVPQMLQNRVLSEIHKSHLGIVKCKAEARGKVWFPGIDKAIEKMISSCDICIKLRSSPARAPLAVWPFPPQPFYRVHIDFLGPINNLSYLVIVDSYSKWVEAYNMSCTTSEAVIAKLYEFMSRFGLIHTLVSDNASCFLSSQFTNFCLTNGISHVTAPAYHPASNGQAESYVKIIKKGIKSSLLTSSNAKENNENLLKYLFDYRNSVHITTGSSPAEVVFGRRLRSRLDLINPSKTPSSGDTLVEVVKHNQSLQSKSHGGTNKQRFEPGDTVMYKKSFGNKHFSWEKGVIKSKIGNTLYLVQDIVTLLKFKKHKDQLIRYKGTDFMDKDRHTFGDYASLESSDFPATDLSVKVSQHDATHNSEERNLENQSEQTEHEDFYDASANMDVTQDIDEQPQSSRSGSSTMVLRPVPEVNYKPFL